MNVFKKHAPAILAIVGLVVIALTISWSAVVNLVSPPATAAPKVPTAACGQNLHYYAYDAAKGSHNFGPAIQAAAFKAPTMDLAARDVLSATFKRDPLNFSTNVEFAKHGLRLSGKTAIAHARFYVAHPNVWCTSVRNFFTTAHSWKLVNIKRHYYSVGMVPRRHNRSLMPGLVRGSTPVDVDLALRYTYHGVVRIVRLKCRIQPIELRPFTNVPSRSAPPTKSTPSTPGHTTPGTPTPTCTPPPYSGQPGYTTGCNAHKIPQSYNCQQNSGPCAPNPAHQPVQSNDPSITAQPSTVPSRAPSRQPTRPVNTRHPGPPNNGGTNGGSTHNPVVSGTPTPVDSGSHTGIVAPPP